MNVNTGFEIKFEPDKQKSFLLFGQSCFVDVSLIESGLLLALVPKINKIIEWEIIVNLKFANIVHFFKLFKLFFRQIFHVKRYKENLAIIAQRIFLWTLLPNLLLFIDLLSFLLSHFAPRFFLLRCRFVPKFFFKSLEILKPYDDKSENNNANKNVFKLFFRYFDISKLNYVLIVCFNLIFLIILRVL